MNNITANIVHISSSHRVELLYGRVSETINLKKHTNREVAIYQREIIPRRQESTIFVHLILQISGVYSSPFLNNWKDQPRRVYSQMPWCGLGRRNFRGSLDERGRDRKREEERGRGITTENPADVQKRSPSVLGPYPARDRVVTLFQLVRGQPDVAPHDKLRIVSRQWRASSRVD